MTSSVRPSKPCGMPHSRAVSPVAVNGTNLGPLPAYSDTFKMTAVITFKHNKRDHKQTSTAIVEIM